MGRGRLCCVHVWLTINHYLRERVINLDKKVERILSLYSRLTENEVLNKVEEAEKFNVNERTIQRDLDDIRAYLAGDSESQRELVYDRMKKGYVIVQHQDKRFTNGEILAVCKILLESRAMVKEEMYPIIDKLLKCCIPFGNYKKVEGLIGNEKFHYIEPQHGKKFVDAIWDISSAVYEHRLMKIRYQKLNEPDLVMRMIQPVGIMFSEYYFYLCAYISLDETTPDIPKHPFPTTYRIDRIAEYEVMEQRFHVPYADRFEEGEFRKRIQFMFGGELRTVRFIYKGVSIEAVLDRLPTAKVLGHDEKGWMIRAEVYGNGIDMWLRSQGNLVEVLEERK